MSLVFFHNFIYILLIGVIVVIMALLNFFYNEISFWFMEDVNYCIHSQIKAFGVVFNIATVGVFTAKASFVEVADPAHSAVLVRTIASYNNCYCCCPSHWNFFWFVWGSDPRCSNGSTSLLLLNVIKNCQNDWDFQRVHPLLLRILMFRVAHDHVCCWFDNSISLDIVPSSIVFLAAHCHQSSVIIIFPSQECLWIDPSEDMLWRSNSLFW